VLPALIRRFADAVETGDQAVTLWGSGRPRREFLHVDDLAAACVRLLESYDAPEPINVGTGQDVTIRELAGIVAEVVGYRGEVWWDTGKPDGTLRKLLDTSRIRALGWAPRVGLRDGIAETVGWYRENAGLVGAGSVTNHG
jgi:GDP-L-fucose synthase